MRRAAGVSKPLEGVERRGLANAPAYWIERPLPARLTYFGVVQPTSLPKDRAVAPTCNGNWSSCRTAVD